MIKELRSNYPVRVLCRVLRVSRSGYHAWATRPASERAKARARLCVAAQAAHRRTRSTYGAVRLQKELASDGFATSLGTLKGCVAKIKDGRKGSGPASPYAATWNRLTTNFA